MAKQKKDPKVAIRKAVPGRWTFEQGEGTFHAFKRLGDTMLDVAGLSPGSPWRAQIILIKGESVLVSVDASEPGKALKKVLDKYQTWLERQDSILSRT